MDASHEGLLRPIIKAAAQKYARYPLVLGTICKRLGHRSKPVRGYQKPNTTFFTAHGVSTQRRYGPWATDARGRPSLWENKRRYLTTP